MLLVLYLNLFLFYWILLSFNDIVIAKEALLPSEFGYTDSVTRQYVLCLLYYTYQSAPPYAWYKRKTSATFPMHIRTIPLRISCFVQHIRLTVCTKHWEKKNMFFVTSPCCNSETDYKTCFMRLVSCTPRNWNWKFDRKVNGIMVCLEKLLTHKWRTLLVSFARKIEQKT